LEYFFIGKIKEFVDPSSAVGNNSGLQRSFTTLLGLEVFKNFPIFGVGAGNSYFFMHTYEYNIGIWSEMLTHSTPPQNTHSMILAETGAVGYFIFILFYISTIWVSVREYIKNRDNMLKAHIIGTVAQFGFLISVFPVYSIYNWFNIALLLNKLYFLKYYDKNNS
jgi:O-antigen ligase